VSRPDDGLKLSCSGYRRLNRGVVSDHIKNRDGPSRVRDSPSFVGISVMGVLVISRQQQGAEDCRV